MNATGKPIFFNSCEWGVDQPWEWMHQYANSWRTGPDHHDDWKTTSAIIEVNANLGQYAGNIAIIDNLHNSNERFLEVSKGWNDPDFLMTGGQVSYNQSVSLYIIVLRGVIHQKIQFIVPV